MTRKRGLDLGRLFAIMHGNWRNEVLLHFRSANPTPISILAIPTGHVLNRIWVRLASQFWSNLSRHWLMQRQTHIPSWHNSRKWIRIASALWATLLAASGPC